MKNTILMLSFLLFGSNVFATQLSYVSEDGIKVFSRYTEEMTAREGHCRQDENPYNPDSVSDFCDKEHLDAYRKIIETQEINFADKYILAFIKQNPNDEISIDKKSGKTILKLADDFARDVVSIDPKTKSVYTFYLGVQGTMEFGKTTNTFDIKGSIHGYRMDNDGEYFLFFGKNHFDESGDSDDHIDFYTHPCGLYY